MSAAGLLGPYLVECRKFKVQTVPHLCLGLLWSHFELEVAVEHDAGVLARPPHQLQFRARQQLLRRRAEVEEARHHEEARQHLVSADQATDLGTTETGQDLNGVGYFNKKLMLLVAFTSGHLVI